MIDVGGRFDLSAYKSCSDAITRARRDPTIAAIVIDLSETYLLFDSGKAILLDMAKRARTQRIPLCLINANPEIRRKLPNINLSMNRRRKNNNSNHLREAS